MESETSTLLDSVEFRLDSAKLVAEIKREEAIIKDDSIKCFFLINYLSHFLEDLIYLGWPTMEKYITHTR